MSPAGTEPSQPLRRARDEITSILEDLRRNRDAFQPATPDNPGNPGEQLSSVQRARHAARLLAEVERRLVHVVTTLADPA